ncbi:MAG: heavy-metal-associated domain-containing protein [Pelagibacterales bacterium]|nr:heavy-metal-associated domain-containing protein [Pelagibacterales bacterium]
MKKKSKIIIAIIIFLPFVWVFWPSNSTEQISKPNPEEIVELMGTETSFGVKGNCGMCKETIESAANSLDGVITADWNKETKQLSLVYDSQIIDLLSVHQAIANSGYGTELVDYDMDKYENLPLCCKYDPLMEVKIN